MSCIMTSHWSHETSDKNMEKESQLKTLKDKCDETLLKQRDEITENGDNLNLVNRIQYKAIMDSSEETIARRV